MSYWATVTGSILMTFGNDVSFVSFDTNKFLEIYFPETLKIGQEGGIGMHLTSSFDEKYHRFNETLVIYGNLRGVEEPTHFIETFKSEILSVNIDRFIKLSEATDVNDIRTRNYSYKYGRGFRIMAKLDQCAISIFCDNENIENEGDRTITWGSPLD